MTTQIIFDQNGCKKLEICLNPDGTLDEILSYDENGECDFHLEQMDTSEWWMKWYSTKRHIHKEVNVYIKPTHGIIEYDE